MPKIHDIPGILVPLLPIYFDSFSSGVSQYKQAFSTSDGNLLVRKKPCACSACIDMDWENCALKVNTTPRSNQCFELS